MVAIQQPQSHPARTIARFTRDERGALLVFFALSLVVILGFAAVILDLGRTATTQTELQSHADNLALAAAAELDGEPDSIDRAHAAVRALLAVRAEIGAGRTPLDDEDFTLRFYADLPADGRDPLPDATSDPARARFVQAEIAPRDVALSVTRAFDALLPREPRAPPRVAADAVAGFTRQVCEVALVLFCLPDSDWNAEENIGQMVQMRGGGGDAQWGPGNFGFLDPSPGSAVAGGPCDNLNGGNLRDCLFAAEAPTTGCFAVRGVDTLPGQRMGNAASALNVRFDEFEKGMNKESGNPAYRPAPNVVRGIVEPSGGNQCRAPENAEPNTVAPPRDTCLQNGTCTPERFGDGVSAGALNAYLARNHGDANGNYAFEIDGMTVLRDWGDDDDLDGVPEETPPAPLIDLVNDPERAPRYEIYRAEIENAGKGDILDKGDGPGQKRESGRPVCAPTRSADPDRRVLLAAGIDCAAHDLQGRTTDIPVQEYVRLFLTEPVGTSGNDAGIWAEVIGSGERDRPGRSVAIIRDLVRLVR